MLQQTYKKTCQSAKWMREKIKFTWELRGQESIKKVSHKIRAVQKQVQLFKTSKKKNEISWNYYLQCEW